VRRLLVVGYIGEYTPACSSKWIRVGARRGGGKDCGGEVKSKKRLERIKKKLPNGAIISYGRDTLSHPKFSRSLISRITKLGRTW